MINQVTIVLGLIRRTKATTPDSVPNHWQPGIGITSSTKRITGRGSLNTISCTTWQRHVQPTVRFIGNQSASIDRLGDIRAEHGVGTRRVKRQHIDLVAY